MIKMHDLTGPFDFFITSTHISKLQHHCFLRFGYSLHYPGRSSIPFIHSFFHFLHLFPSLEGPLASLFANAAAAAHALHLDSRTLFFGSFNEVLGSFLCAKN